MWPCWRNLSSLWLLLALLPTCASAQEDAEQGRAAVVEEEAYWALIEDAIREAESGHHREALVLFREAHEARPSARTLRGIGLMQFELRHYVDAIDSLSQALEDPRRPLTDEGRAEVTRALTRARSFITTVTVELTPSEATIAVDGRQVTLAEDGVLHLDPGEHEIRASAPGYAVQNGQIDTDGGEELTLRLALGPLVPAAPAVPAAVAMHAPPRVWLHVQSEQAGLRLHALPLNVVNRRLRVETSPGAALCTAPCDYPLMAGPYQLGVARGESRALSAGVHELRAPSDLVLAYADRSDARLAGWIALATGGVTTALLIGLAFSEADGWIGLSAVPTGAVTLTLTLVLTLLRDVAHVEIRPRAAL